MAMAPRSLSAAGAFVDVADDDGCLSLVLQDGDLPGEAVRNGDVLCGEIARVADGDPPAVHETARTFAGARLKGGAFPMRQPALLASGDDRLCERMLGLRFDGCSELQQRQCGCVGVAAEVHDAAIDDHIRDSRLAFGERPGLVEGHDLHRGRAFEMDAAFEQDPAPRRATDRGQDGSRRADDQRARRRHNHHGHGAVERGLKRFLQEQDRNNNQPDRE